jgi:hypothetical protein
VTTAELPRRLEYMPLSEVVEAARNPKLHDADGIAASISRHGLAEVPTLDDRTGRLVAGHGRIQDLRDRYTRGQDPPGGVVVDEDGEWRVPILRGWASASDDAAAAYLIGSNGLTTSGGWDQHGLAEILKELRDADPYWLESGVTGHTANDLDDLLALLAPPDLDDLRDDLGDPDGTDTWPVVRVKVPTHLHAAWRTQVDEHEGDEVAALAELLGVDAAEPDTAKGPVWEPDRTVSP